MRVASRSAVGIIDAAVELARADFVALATRSTVALLLASLSVQWLPLPPPQTLNPYSTLLRPAVYYTVLTFVGDFLVTRRLLGRILPECERIAGTPWANLMAHFGMLAVLRIGITLLLLPALVLPGALFFYLTATAAPALLAEGRAAPPALLRAFALSRGAWLKSAATVGFGWLVLFVLTFGLAVLLPYLLGVDVRPLSATLRLLASAAVYPFLVAINVLLYVDRRVAREALDLELAGSALTSQRAPQVWSKAVTSTAGP